MLKALQTHISKLFKALFWSIVALFDGKHALAECDMTDPVITDTERLGRNCDRMDDKEEDWQPRDRYAAKVKVKFCDSCKERTEDEWEKEMWFRGVKYTIKIDCRTCKKHGKG